MQGRDVGCVQVMAHPNGRGQLVVRAFARHLHTLDPSCEVPPADLLSGRSQRPTPYIYTDEEVAVLVHAAGTMAPPMPAATCHAVISLIAASGLRLGDTLGWTAPTSIWTPRCSPWSARTSTRG